MKITLQIIYNELQEIRKDLRLVPLIKWMAALALFISLGALIK